MMLASSLLGPAIAGAVVLALGGCAGGQASPAIAPPSVSDFNRDAVQRGFALAMVGDCQTCHTAEGGDPYAGGRAIGTPFGAVYATNITPDPATGIGRWSPRPSCGPCVSASGATARTSIRPFPTTISITPPTPTLRTCTPT